MTTPHPAALRKVALHLTPYRQELLDAWVAAVTAVSAGGGEALRDHCARDLQAVLEAAGGGDLEALLGDDAVRAVALVGEGHSLAPAALAIRLLERCCLPYLLKACPEPEALAECLLALAHLAARRLEALLRVQEDESARRLVDLQEQAARQAEATRAMALANQELRRAEARSQRRADQIGLLSAVARRIAQVMEPERLMQEAADAIQGGLNHSYVAVVVLDDEGVLVGRWASRPSMGQRRAGRAQGPPGGIIGRTLRKRAPQVVPDVDQDPDFHRDVPQTRSEMVIPLLEAGEAVGAIDFQSELVSTFDLDAVAAGEALAEFLVIGLRNARLLAEARSGSDLR